MNQGQKKQLGRRKRCFLERLEPREVMAGNVSASIAGGNVVLSGDPLGNQVTIARNSPTSITITGINTTINGGNKPITFNGFQRDLTVNLNAGNDIVRFVNSSDSVFQVLGNLTVKTGDGADQVHFAQVSVGGKLSVDTGAGNDRVSTSTGSGTWGLEVASAASILAASGKDNFTIDNANFHSTATIKTGNDNDQLAITDSAFAGIADLQGGSGTDGLTIGNSSFAAALVRSGFESQSIGTIDPADNTEEEETPTPGPTENPPPAYEGPFSGIVGNVITEGITLVVATTGSNVTGLGTATKPFGSISRALDFLADKVIAANVHVVISVRDGTYVLPGAIEMTHGNGSQIDLIGNVSNPAAVTLTFPNSTDGIYLRDSHTLGYLNGFTFRGEWALSGNAGLATSGIRASANASITLGDQMIVKNFYYGVQADQGGFVEADRVKVIDAGDAGLFAYDGGIIDASYATVTRAVDTTRGLGSGVVAEIGGRVRCNNIVVTDCLKAGLQAIGGNIRADNFSANSNRRYGVYVERNGIFDADGICSANNNRSDGVHVESGGVFSTFGALTVQNNAGSGLFVSQGTARIATGARFLNNTGSGINARAKSSVIVTGATVTGNRECGVDAQGISYVEITSSTISGSPKGVRSTLGSFVLAKGNTLKTNTVNYAIPVNVLSADGSMISTS